MQEWYWVKAAIAIFQFELPEVPIPQVNGWSVMAHALQETYHQLFPIVFTPFMEAWSFVASIVLAVYEFKPPVIAAPDTSSFEFGKFLLWIWTASSSFLGGLTDAETIVHAFTTMVHFLLNLLFATPFEELDQYLETVPVLGEPFFIFRYWVQWIMFPMLIIIRGFWATIAISNTGAFVLANVALPTYFMMMNEAHPKAFRDCLFSVLLFIFLVSQPCHF